MASSLATWPGSWAHSAEEDGTQRVFPPFTQGVEGFTWSVSRHGAHHRRVLESVEVSHDDCTESKSHPQ